MPLTKRQREILDYLSVYVDENGYAPSFEEIATKFSYSSLATVHEHLSNLERKGYIRRSYNESRAIELLPSEHNPRAVEVPLLGSVAAGLPIEELDAGESIAVPDSFVRRNGRHFALRVKGNSMIDEHIRDGDVVVVHERQSADNGEMVIAMLDGLLPSAELAASIGKNTTALVKKQRTWFKTQLPPHRTIDAANVDLAQLFSE